MIVVNLNRIKETGRMMTENGWSIEIQTESQTERGRIIITGELVYMRYGEIKTADEYKEEFVKTYLEQFSE